MTSYAVDLQAVREAAGRLANLAHRTPVCTCATLDRLAGRSLFFKCENFQKVGAFKFRGACNAVARLPAEAAARGVVTHSSGNHAQALALAAKLRGIPAHIVMPSNAAAVKRRAVEDYGARVIECEPTLAARETTAARVLADTGGTLIPPYDHPDVIAGQGTAALELLEQVAGLDGVVAPVGGGGLLAGVAVAVRGLRPGLKVFAAEPLGADDAARSKAAGMLIPQTGPRTVADGLLTSLGNLTWPVLRDQVERVVTVREDEIVSAMRLTWERAKLLIEPSAAVAVAAVLSEEFRTMPGLARVGVILSGGNVDLDRLPWRPALPPSPPGTGARGEEWAPLPRVRGRGEKNGPLSPEYGDEGRKRCPGRAEIIPSSRPIWRRPPGPRAFAPPSGSGPQGAWPASSA